MVLLGGVAIAVAAPEAKPAGTMARTLRFDVRFSPFHLVDADGDGAPSLGDYPVFHDILLRDGEEVGDEGGTCPIVHIEQGLIHCTGTMRLPGRQLTFQGLTTTAPTKQLAITGGTGHYQVVGGEATLALLLEDHRPGLVVEVLFVERCPNLPAALALVERVAAELGRPG